jgi:hypothetical protein
MYCGLLLAAQQNNNLTAKALRRKGCLVKRAAALDTCSGRNEVAKIFQLKYSLRLCG